MDVIGNNIANVIVQRNLARVDWRQRHQQRHILNADWLRGADFGNQ
jgi:hypothetical protein